MTPINHLTLLRGIGIDPESLTEYVISECTKEKAISLITPMKVYGFDITEQEIGIANSDQLWLLDEMEGWQTKVLYNNYGTVFLIIQIKPKLEKSI